MHPYRRNTAIVTLGLTAALTCAGCDRAGDDTDVRRAALSFLEAAQRHDGAAACAALAPKARSGLESGGDECAKEIVGRGLRTGAVTGVQVWGERAQVRLAGDTVFLARFPGGWKVTAAACESRPKGPYDCQVEA
ncbi:hypothetical protein [Actinomadura macrotermitis]|uniref:Lipoprotein n=1 Tax=Actinomadura macrotermitis TaxID=2585200 RepID=A0A7K0BUR3_9ACTN|nr:hypothetical protein [Actinomadura macrotermitis]MQY04901.1 hypothetical protein [Actinomadura macrotermitis]